MALDTTEITDAEIRRLAVERYASDDVEIDGNAVISRGDDPGCFVAAWVWVDFPEQAKGEEA